MINFVLFDLDNTLVDSTHLKSLRNARTWREVYRRIESIELFDGVLNMWKALQQHGVHLGVVTHSPRPYAERVLRHVALAPDVLVGYHDLHGNRKPSPYGYQRCCDGRPSDGGAAVGDERNDLLAADAFGCAGIVTG